MGKHYLGLPNGFIMVSFPVMNLELKQTLRGYILVDNYVDEIK